MEIREAVSLSCETMHSRLTPMRMIRGVLCLVVLVSTASMMVLYPGFLSAVMLRLFSLRYSRKAISFFFGAWLALWPLLFEKINKTRVIFSGDEAPAGERVLLISNHRTEVDWMYLWDFALRKDCLGYVRYILKSSLMKLPIFGWAFHILEFIPVDRRWEVDEKIIRSMLSTFKNHKDPLWLVLFPEGTDYTERKCLSSKKYAAEKGLPVLNNVLLPKSRGFSACLEDLRGSLDAVYDVTIGYKHQCPSFLDNVFGVDPAEVHIHVRRVSPQDIPTSEKDVSAWLMDAYSLKDKLLSEFYAGGGFPGAGTEADLSTTKCLVNFIFVIMLTCACTCFTFFSSVWFKVYISFVCIYLASATYLDVRPTEILSFMRPFK